MRGRKPTPTKVLQLRGTFRKDRHADAANAPEPTAVKRLPKAPAILDEVGQTEWKRVGKELMDVGLLTAVDMGAFTGYCASLSRAIQAEAVLRERGLTTTTPQGFEIARPEIAIAKHAWAEARKFGIEFGFTPSARMRVKAPGKPAEKSSDDPWDEVADG